MSANRFPKGNHGRGRKRPDSGDPEDETPARDAPRSGTITAITPQRHDTDRVSILLDKIFAFGLHADLVLEYGLYPGLELDDTTTATILIADERRKATAAALQLLSYRARSEGEIATRLTQRAFSPEAIEATLVRLREWHYVDDADFATRWVENRQLHRPRSERMLAHELRQKGVDAATITDTIDEAGVDEVGDAKALVAKQRAKLSELETDIQTRRITGFLARRGYGYDVIRRALVVDEETDLE